MAAPSDDEKPGEGDRGQGGQQVFVPAFGSIDRHGGAVTGRHLEGMAEEPGQAPEALSGDWQEDREGHDRAAEAQRGRFHPSSQLAFSVHHQPGGGGHGQR